MVEIQNSVKSHIPIHSGSSSESKIEIEGGRHLRDCSTVTEEKIVPEGKNKADINVNRAVNHSTVSGNISSFPKTCSIMVLDSSSDLCKSSGADAGKEKGVHKIMPTSLSAVNSKLSPMSSSISASKMSHLIVRRPLPILHTSRTDFVPSVFNNDKVQILSQGLSSSGVGAAPSRGVGVLPHARRLEIHSPNGKVESNNFSSPPAFPDGEDSVGVKVNDNNVAVNNATVKSAVSSYLSRKRNVLVKGRTADNVEARGPMLSPNLMVTPATKKVEQSQNKIPVQSVWCNPDGYRRLPQTSMRKSGGPSVFNNDKVQILSQGLSSSGVDAAPSSGVGVLPHARRLEIHSPNGKVESNSFSSPPALPDGEDSGVSLYLSRKRNVLVKGRTADNVEARGPMLSPNLMVTPATKKVEQSQNKIPVQSVWCNPDVYRRLPQTSMRKSGGPPLKKQMVRKSSIHSRKVVNSAFQAFAERFPGELDDDREELLIAADFARNASYRACSNSLWKKLECYFTSVTSQDEGYVKHQLDLADAFSRSFYQIPGDKNDDLGDLKLQHHPSYSGGTRKSSADQKSIGTAALSKCSDITKTLGEAPSLYQRVISALIEDDETREMSLHCEGINGFQCDSDDSHCGSYNYNGFEAKNRDGMTTNDINCKAKGRRMDYGVDRQLRKQGHVPWISQSGLNSSLKSTASPISSPNCNYHMLSVENKLQLELQSIDIAEGEDTINKDILELQAELVQQVHKKKKYLRKIHESVVQEKNAEKRKVEQAAMSKLLEMAYKKQRVSRASHSTKRVLRRVSKEAALPFAERTLARCREFEDTGRSCFSEAALQNIIFSTPMYNSLPNSVHKQISRSSPKHNLQPKGSGSRDKQQYMVMNQDLLPNDVCSDSLRATSGGSAKGKRSERARDHTNKTKLKPKVKASYLASEAETGSRSMEPTHAATDSRGASSLSLATGSDVARRLKEPQNVEQNLVNPPRKPAKSISVDVDGGEDEEWIGLYVPMDDLSDVQLFI